MAHDALHLYFIDRVASDPALPRDLAELLRLHAGSASVGALLIDLPYFDGFASKVAGHFTGRAESESEWGDRLHRVVAFGLLRALLDSARDQSGGDALRALAFGHLTHAALDIATHPSVNRFVRARGGDPHREHRLVENVQLELWHRRTLGHRAFASRSLLRLASASQPLLRGGTIAAGVTRALQIATGHAPTAAEWRRWTWGLWQYTALVASPLGRGYLPERDIADAHAWFDGQEVDFIALWEGAIRRAVAEASRLWELVRSEAPLDRASFAAQFPETNLDDPERPPLQA